MWVVFHVVIRSTRTGTCGGILAGLHHDLDTQVRKDTHGRNRPCNHSQQKRFSRRKGPFSRTNQAAPLQLFKDGILNGWFQTQYPIRLYPSIHTLDTLFGKHRHKEGIRTFICFGCANFGCQTIDRQCNWQMCPFGHTSHGEVGGGGGVRRARQGMVGIFQEGISKEIESLFSGTLDRRCFDALPKDPSPLFFVQTLRILDHGFSIVPLSTL
mmetsp:Transcript_82/g.140  ORF Transcript_82/g.140 Transcript_82/m.140 type:complete len:212 (-) Transcript_82:222-857(-)